VAWYANRPSLWIPQDDERIPDLRKRLGTVNWLYLTRDAQDNSQQWMIIYDTFRQWNAQVIQSRIQHITPPPPFKIAGKGIPLYEALEGFIPMDLGYNYTPVAVIGYLPSATGP
jgi:hypothetical protein